MKKIIVIIISVVVCIFPIHAQDIHFSQYYAAPINLNPAMTGYMGGDQRAVLNYRNQWSSISSPYVTMAGSFDAALFRDDLGGDWVGGGILLAKDQAGTLSLARTRVALSGSYVKKLGDKNYLSAGGQAGFNQRSIDYTNMLVDAQITPSGFDNSLPHNEDVSKLNKTFFDYNAGVIWGYRPSDFLDVYTGLALMNFNGPKDGMIDGDKTLGMRTVFHSGANLVLNEKWILQPALIFQAQKNVGELIIGGAFGRDLEPTNEEVTRIAYAGVWYRNKDAIVPYAGVEIESWKLGISYDINMSDLNLASQNKGGFELSLKWEIPRPNLRMYRAVPCPRF